MTNKKLFLGTDRGYCVPVWFIPKIVQWITGQVEPGDFLQAVLYNNLGAAVGVADEVTLECLSGIIKFMHNEAPAACWGTPEKAQAWLEIDGHEHAYIAREWADAHPEFVKSQPEFELVEAGMPATLLAIRLKQDRMRTAFCEIITAVEGDLPIETINAMREEHGMSADVPFAEILTERVINAVT